MKRSKMFCHGEKEEREGRPRERNEENRRRSFHLRGMGEGMAEGNNK